MMNQFHCVNSERRERRGLLLSQLCRRLLVTAADEENNEGEDEYGDAQSHKDLGPDRGSDSVDRFEIVKIKIMVSSGLLDALNYT